MNRYILSLMQIISILLVAFVINAEACEECKRRGEVIVTNDVVDIETDYLHPGSATTSTLQGVGSNCFAIVLSPERIEWVMKHAEEMNWPFSPEVREPDYIFRTHFENSLTGVTKPKGWVFSDDETDYWEAKSRLTVQMYYNGENEELVETWEILGTTNRSAPCARRMWTNSQSEFKKKNPLDIMYRYEETPTECDINPEKEKVSKSEEIEIELANFTGLYGGPSKGFNRVIVHAYHGKITNGATCEIGPDYKVFNVGSGTVKVEYRAPDECDETEDRITVYNSCDILPNSKWPLGKTELHEKIEEKEIEIVCWDWTGTLTIKWNETFECQHKDDNDNATRNIQMNTNRTQEVTVNIGAENILLGDATMDFRICDDWHVYGSMQSIYRDYYRSESRHKKQTDVYSIQETITTSEESFQINQDNISIMIARDPGDFKAAGAELQQMVAEIMASGGDEKMIDDAMNRVDQMFRQDENSVPLRFQVQIRGDFAGAIRTKDFLERNGKVERNDNKVITGQAALPVAAEFKGTMTIDENGKGSIMGSLTGPNTGPAGTSLECPDRKYMLSGSLNLTSSPKKGGE